MAGEALPVLEGRMEHASTASDLCLVVALVAKGAPLLGEGEGSFGRNALMAGIAPRFGDGVVDACLQQSLLSGGVRVVAFQAIGRFHRVVPMRLLERTRPEIVARQAQRSL